MRVLVAELLGREPGFRAFEGAQQDVAVPAVGRVDRCISSDGNDRRKQAVHPVAQPLVAAVGPGGEERRRRRQPARPELLKAPVHPIAPPEAAFDQPSHVPPRAEAVGGRFILEEGRPLQPLDRGVQQAAPSSSHDTTREAQLLSQGRRHCLPKVEA